MKKTLKKLLALGFFYTTLLIYPSKDANALIVLGSINRGDFVTYDPLVDGFSVLLCLATFPICFIDSDANSNPDITHEYLTDNGYSNKEASIILADQAKLAKQLSSTNKTLIIKPDENFKDIKRDIRSTGFNNVTDLYVDFLDKRRL